MPGFELIIEVIDEDRLSIKMVLKMEIVRGTSEEDSVGYSQGSYALSRDDEQ